MPSSESWLRTAAAPWLAAALVAAAGALPAAAAVPAACDRACLTAVMDDYLAHMVRRSPAGLPLARGIVATENAEPTAPGGGGAWNDFTAVRAGQTFTDPPAGQALFSGVLENNRGELTPMDVRLKVRAGEIVESEIVFNTGPGRFFQPWNMLQPDILYDVEVPAARRLSREQMISLIGQYFGAIASGDASQLPLSVRCDKYYAGARVTNSEDGVGTCRGSFKGLTMLPVTKPRFPVVDPERGIIVAIFLLAGRSPAERGGYEWEVFKIIDGQIRSVEELGSVARQETILNLFSSDQVGR